MQPIRGIFKMHTKNVFLWFILPWLVLISSFLVNLLIGFLLGGTTQIYSGGLASIYILLFVIGIVSLSDTFPLALGFSVRRLDYILGTMFVVMATCAGSTLVLLLFSILEHNVISGWGVGLHFFFLPYLNDGSLLEQYLLFFFLLVHMYLLGFVIGCIYRRFGKRGMWTFVCLTFVVLTTAFFLCTYFQRWNMIITWFQQHTAFGLGLWIVPLLLCYTLISYLLLRKATI